MPAAGLFWLILLSWVFFHLSKLRKGLNFTSSARWDEIVDVDFRQEIVSVQVPIYFLVGKYDMIAPTEPVEDFYKSPGRRAGEASNYF